MFLGWIGLPLVAVGGAGALFGTVSPYLDLAGQFALQAGLLALALTALLLIVRSWRLATGMALAAVVVLAAMIPRGPSLQPCTASGTHRIVFLNLWARNPDIASAIDYLAHTGADAVVLVEVRPYFDDAMDQLRAVYPYAADCPGLKHCGITAYSRVPMTLNKGDDAAHILDLQVEFPDGELHLGGVHLMRPWPFLPAGRQRRQARGVAKAIARMGRPKIAVGDFNAVPWGAVMDTVVKTAGLSVLSSHGTWRSDLPWPLRIPIDQALVGSGLKCATKSVSKRLSSDHRAIIVDFAFQHGRNAAPHIVQP